MKDTYIRIKNREEFNEVVNDAVLCPLEYTPVGLKAPYETIKQHYHRNSKLLAHLYYNNISKRYEFEFTTASKERTYPQIRYKKLNIIDWKDAPLDLFGIKLVDGYYIPIGEAVQSK